MKTSNTPKPVNFATGKTYQGENAKTLQQVAIDKGYTSHEWATMNQWNNSKRSIARFEKGTAIKYTRVLESEQGPVDIVDTAYVFNRNQLMRSTVGTDTK